MALLDQSRLPCNPARLADKPHGAATRAGRRFGIRPAAFGWLALASE